MRNRTESKTTNRMVLRAKGTCLVAASAFLLVVGGCERPESVQAIKTPEEVLKAKKERRIQAKAEKPRAARRTPRPRPAPARTPKPTPKPTRQSMTVLPPPMRFDKATTDSEGGYKLLSETALQQDGVQVDFTVTEVVLEMKGEPAHDIWPEVKLNMYNQTEKKNFFPWPRNYVTTSSYHLYPRVLERPMPPGKYLVTFQYHNDAVPSGSKADRTVSLRKITLLGKEEE